MKNEILLKQLEITEGKLRVMNQLVLANVINKAINALKECSKPAMAVPVELNCTQCGAAHIDEGEWATRLHKTHQCQHCGHEWRPFEYPTVGVAPSHSQQSTQHITEKDAKTIAQNYKSWREDREIGYLITPEKWFESVGRDLLSKLNADRCPIHDSNVQPDEELPGLWSNSDLSGGYADSCNEKEEKDDDELNEAYSYEDEDWFFHPNDE